MSHASVPRPEPAADYDGAMRRFAALAAKDGPEISSAGRSRFYGHGTRTERAVVFVHGFTNCPQQWTLFAHGLHAAGDSIVIPRLPGHGFFDRATPQAALATSAETLATVNDAVDIARGLSERVTLVGLSIGGTVGPRIALERDDIAHTVSMVPFFAVKNFDETGTKRLSAALGVMPNFELKWDPFGDGSAIPSYGYPKFSTHMLARFLEIAGDVSEIAGHRVPAGLTTFVFNAREPACNNAVSLAVARDFEAARAGSTKTIVWSDLPANHDIVDPTNPNQRIDTVYPRLRAIIHGTS